MQLAVGNAKVNIVQHTEGCGDTSRSMLDLSMSGISDIVDTLGVWLGVDGSMHAGEPPAGCVGAQTSSCIHSMGLNHQDCEVLVCTGKQSLDVASDTSMWMILAFAPLSRASCRTSQG